MNGKPAVESGLVIPEEDAPNAKEAVTSKNYEVSTAKFEKAASYKIIITVADNAGNTDEFEKQFTLTDRHRLLQNLKLKAQV